MERSIRMTATAVTQSGGSTWFDSFQRNAYFFKPAIVATLITGLYLHISVLFLGHRLVVDYIATPQLDMLLAIPMTYGAILSWILWRRVVHPSGWHRFVYGVLAVYFTISIPFHARTYLAGNTEVFLKFPVWYSAMLLPYLTGLLVFAWRLQFKPR
jgi:hypothetical protein